MSAICFRKYSLLMHAALFPACCRAKTKTGSFNNTTQIYRGGRAEEPNLPNSTKNFKLTFESKRRVLSRLSLQRRAHSVKNLAITRKRRFRQRTRAEYDWIQQDVLSVSQFTSIFAQGWSFGSKFLTLCLELCNRYVAFVNETALTEIRYGPATKGP